MNELKLAEAAHEAAREAMADAVAAAERIAERLEAGDETVSISEAMEAPAAVLVAEAKVKAAERRLRQVEDTQALPASPALRVSAGVTEAGRVLAGAEKAAQTARAGLLKAEHSLLRAQGKLEAAEGRLAEAVAGDPSTAIHFANLLVNSGVTGCNVEVISRGGLTAFSRGTLPVVHVAPNGAGSVSVCHLGRYANDALPDAEAISRALSLDGWAGGFGEWSEADEAPEDCVMHTAVLELRPRGTLPWAGWEDAGSDERSADMLDGLNEILADARRALRGEHRNMKVYTSTNRAPLALSVTEDGFHTVKVGMVVSHYTSGSTKLTPGTAVERAQAAFWAALVGQVDWELGVVVKVEKAKGVPSWAGSVPLDTKGSTDAFTQYAEITTAFRVAAGRAVERSMLGLADAA